MTIAIEPDPSWFYSSLAQSTAAVVGFVGAFLIFRIQDYMNGWARDSLDLDTLQRQWSAAKVETDSQEREWERAVERKPLGPPAPKREDFVDALRERDEQEAWRNLRPMLDRRGFAEFPGELVLIAALIGALFASAPWLRCCSSESRRTPNRSAG